MSLVLINMKYVVVLALIVAVSARPADVFRALHLRDSGSYGGSDGGDDKGEFGGMPEGPVEPITGEDILELLRDGGQFASDVQAKFQGLRAKAADLSDSAEDLDKLGGHVVELMHGLDEMKETREKDLGARWEKLVYRLVFAGVADEGQCHKILEFLMAAVKEHADPSGAAKRSDDAELKFWRGVAAAGGEEVECIIHRIQEFIELIHGVADAIKNGESDEEGHAFEAEVVLGSLLAGYKSVDRQIEVFVKTIHALMTEAGESQQQERLINLLKEAQSLKRSLDNMKAFKSLAHRK